VRSKGRGVDASLVKEGEWIKIKINQPPVMITETF
jgi:hypothetical protein